MIIMTSEQILLVVSVLFCFVAAEKEDQHKGVVEDHCLTETFQPQCLKNEVILMKSATYGRMRTGRCITAEEVAAQRRQLAGEEIRLLGCSADVLEILDRRCTGNVECSIPVAQIPDENIQPCFPGLKMYLETSYDCIIAADERRSCEVTASKNPLHIICSSTTDRICGTKTQPWIIRSSGGQKIRVVLIDLLSSLDGTDRTPREKLCRSGGVVVDKEEKRNISFCVDGDKREKELYTSPGNTIRMTFNSSVQPDTQATSRSSNSPQFMIKVTAVGCSDVIPPEDSWLKRNGDAIIIGCYSSRQTWHLSCREGTWTGVVGNCSMQNTLTSDSATKLEQQSLLSDNGQVLAMVAIVGFTLTICLAIMSVGAICLRRYYKKSKKITNYRTLQYDISSARRVDQSHPNGVATDVNLDNVVYGQETVPAATFSVYAGISQQN